MKTAACLAVRASSAFSSSLSPPQAHQPARTRSQTPGTRQRSPIPRRIASSKRLFASASRCEKPYLFRPARAGRELAPADARCQGEDRRGDAGHKVTPPVECRPFLCHLSNAYKCRWPITNGLPTTPGTLTLTQFIDLSTSIVREMKSGNQGRRRGGVWRLLSKVSTATTASSLAAR
jgi:hypothetical protein